MTNNPINIFITSDDRNLVASGTFITFPVGDSIINIDSNEEPLKFVFRFFDDETDKSTRVVPDIKSKSTLELRLFNFNNELGNFNLEPAKIGTVYNRELFFSYFINSLGATRMKKITYSFYLGKEVTNGRN